jgi:hypothetical protein
VKDRSVVIAVRHGVALQWSLGSRTKSSCPLPFLRRKGSTGRGLGSGQGKRLRDLIKFHRFSPRVRPPKIGDFRSIDTVSIVTPRAVASGRSCSIVKVAHRAQWINQEEWIHHILALSLITFALNYPEASLLSGPCPNHLYKAHPT